MILRMIGKLKLSNGTDYFSLLYLKLDATSTAILEPSNLSNCGRDDLMDVSLNLSLTNGIKAWSANLSLDFFEKNAAQIKMPIGKYIDLTIKALANVIDGKYVYEIVERGKSSVQFSWKEQMTKDEITIKLGSCNLQAEDITKITCLMLSFSTERISELENQTKASEAEMQSLTNDREQALKKLENFVSEKEILEKDLYAKFVAVLNKKKRKIKSLEEQLENTKDMETTPASLPQDTSSKSKKPAAKKNQKKRVVAGTSTGTAEYDSGSDTDVEMRLKTSEAQKNPPNDDLLLDNSQNDSFSFTPRKKTKK